MKGKSHLSFLVIGGLFILVCVGSGVVVHLSCDERCEVMLPGDDTIVRVVATLYDVPGVARATPGFEIPRTYIPKLLRAFRPVQQADGPAAPSDAKLAHLKVFTSTRPESYITIIVYLSGKNPLYFQVDGVDCERRGAYAPIAHSGDYDIYISESVVLAETLEAIYRETVTGARDSTIESQFELLERSASKERSGGRGVPLVQ